MCYSYGQRGCFQRDCPLATGTFWGTTAQATSLTSLAKGIIFGTSGGRNYLYAYLFLRI